MIHIERKIKHRYAYLENLDPLLPKVSVADVLSSGILYCTRVTCSVHSLLI